MKFETAIPKYPNDFALRVLYCFIKSIKGDAHDGASFRRFERVTYQAGEVIFAEGDVGDRAYIIESGIVEIARDVNGKK